MGSSADASISFCIPLLEDAEIPDNFEKENPNFRIVVAGNLYSCSWDLIAIKESYQTDQSYLNSAKLDISKINNQKESEWLAMFNQLPQSIRDLFDPECEPAWRIVAVYG